MNRKKFSVHLDISQLRQPTYLNGPLSTKRKLPQSPMSQSPNNSYLGSDIKKIKPLKQSNSMKSVIQAFSPRNKENQMSKFPLLTEQFIRLYHVTRDELLELQNYKQVYYYKATKHSDSPDGEFICGPRDHAAYRYEIMGLLGSGSFGQVFEVMDHKLKKVYALKMVRNQEKLKKQAAIEAGILQFIKDHDKDQCSNIVRIEESFVFRGHQCIVFEKLDQNLYDMLRQKKFKGFDGDLLRKIAIQILNSLNFLGKHKIIHCDLKPENVLLCDSTKSGIKLVDFGSSCFVGQQIYTYIQSRYYRAPEVIFGLKYGLEIDMWSFACLIAELHMGRPLFPGEDEMDQVNLIMAVIGPPKQEFALRCPRRKYFFDEDGNPKHQGKAKSLFDVMGTDDQELVDFLMKCFTWEPQSRISPLDALKHPWVIQGLPQEIKASHQKYVEIEKQMRNKLKQMTSKVIDDQLLWKFKQCKNSAIETKPILSYRYNGEKPNSVEKSRGNIAQSIYNLLNNKTTKRRPSFMQL